MGEVGGQQKAKYKDEMPYLHDLERKKPARQIYLSYSSIAIEGVTLGRCFVLHAQKGPKCDWSRHTQLHWESEPTVQTGLEQTETMGKTI